ncbi:hypothetical protein ACFFS2_00300 [Streptomyces aurantiacus]|uniref:Secreted protein n=1 Tax=Streptomyces aurantiacus TaxID=47760 RepID=A0A7G1P127_9ACTN|nr:hypothetical protein [Streptomyces aurantiacus]BCL26765.1 hypothetical protein GCM10017557_16240 [Streptomyces aurantiacus]
MTKRTRAVAFATLTAATLALGTVLAGPAGAMANPSVSVSVPVPVSATSSSTPRFLSASQLPPHPTSAWTAGRVTPGVPDELVFCLEDALPGYHSSYRDFRTDLETNAQQLTVVVGSQAKADALAKRLNTEIRACAARIEETDPEIEATLKDYGTLPVEEGAHAYGVHTDTSWGATDINLYSVGRDGRAVTVVKWGQMGDFSDAPVQAFKKTTTTAVDKLY